MQSFSKMGRTLLVAAALALPSAALAEPAPGTNHDQAGNADHGSKHDAAKPSKHDKKKKDAESGVKKQGGSEHAKDSPN